MTHAAKQAATRVPYTYYEVEAIENDYEEQVALKDIADGVNRDFHNGKTVRTVNSVKYVIGRLCGEDGDEWRQKLEEAALADYRGTKE